MNVEKVRADSTAGNVEVLLARLHGVRRSARDRWLALCPAHADRRPSLSIHETADARILLHCFAGCNVHDIVAAVGLELSDLYPPRIDDRQRGARENRPFPAADALRALDEDLLLFLFCSDHLEGGTPLPPSTRAQLAEAAARIHAAKLACGL